MYKREQCYIDKMYCEYITDPIGIHILNPGLSWNIITMERNWTQSAFRIMAASSLEKYCTGDFDLWDSGKLISDKSVNVEYGGKMLSSGQRAYWKLQVWDEEGRLLESKKVAFWEMGLLNEVDWQGKWIGMDESYLSGWSVLLRKEFHITERIRRATVYICGLGYYELYINGAKAGNNVLDPGQTDYEKRVLYTIYDISDMLRQGSNAIGIILGDGWYHQSRLWDNRGIVGGNGIYGNPRAILQLNIELDTGRILHIVSDRTWKTSYGPIVLNNVYAGEAYDARLEQEGWNCPEYNDCRWKKAALVKHPGGRLESQLIPPIRRMKIITPVRVINPRDGIYVFDMGENIAGWARLTVKGHAGMEVTLRFAEELGTDGMLDTNSCGVGYTSVIQTDRYILCGNDTEVWEPRFTYHGFRYVEVAGYPGIPNENSIIGIKVHTSLEEAGSFKCSDISMNRLHTIVRNTITNNLHSIPTDCPTREKCGWTGDAMVIADTAIYNWNTATFWRKYIGDIKSSKEVYGDWMMVVPGKRTCLKAAPAWGSAQVLIPWYLYEFYGDQSTLAESYEPMRKWVAHLEETSGKPELQNLIDFAVYNQMVNIIDDPEKLVLYYGLDDWCAPEHGKTAGRTIPQISTACFYLSTLYTAKAAGVLNKSEDERELLLLAYKIKETFTRKFFDCEKHTYGTQTVNSFALKLGLIPDGMEKHVAKSIAEDLITREYHITVGHIGIRYLFQALCEYGYNDVIKRVFEQNSYPGLGYMLKMGATTLWESWSGKSEGTLNHPFKGGFDIWYYTHVLGIRPGKPGFKEIIIKPQTLDILDHAKGGYNSIYGRIAVEWSRKGELFALHVWIPANTCAKIYIPASSIYCIWESGKLVTDNQSAKYIENRDGYFVFQTGSGQYEFSSIC